LARIYGVPVHAMKAYEGVEV